MLVFDFTKWLCADMDCVLGDKNRLPTTQGHQDQARLPLKYGFDEVALPGSGECGQEVEYSGFGMEPNLFTANDHI
jgi:hypothetical protein